MPQWMQPPREVVIKIERLLDEGRGDKAITNHCSLVEYDVLESQVREIRRDWEQRREYEERRRRSAALSSSTSPTSPSRSIGSPGGGGGGGALGSPTKAAPPPASALRGGPKTWPREVLSQVQLFIEQGYGNSRICNHFTLQDYHLSEQQIQLVRDLPTTKAPGAYDSPKRSSPSKRSSPAKGPSELADRVIAQVRRLVIEGKSNKAVVNHFTVVNDNLTEFQVETLRRKFEKITGATSSPIKSIASPASGLSSSWRRVDLTRQQEITVRALIEQGRSNSYIVNYYSLSDARMPEAQVESLRRQIASENLAASALTRMSSPSRNNTANNTSLSSPPPPSLWRPSTSPSIGRYSGQRRGSDDEEDKSRMKEEHRERLRRKTADKMRRQRMILNGEAF